MEARQFGWSQVDDTGQADYYKDYLDMMSALSSIIEGKRLTYRLLEPLQGATIVDIGCGVGDDVREIGKLVGPSGHVIGLDSSQAMIDEARRRSEGGTLPVEFVLGDACHLPFPDGSIDGCRFDRVLEHLDDPGEAIDEMIRVCKPGGRIAGSEPDWESIVCDDSAYPVDHEIMARLRRDIALQKKQPYVGRKLYALLAKRGLNDVVAKGIVGVTNRYRESNVITGLDAAFARVAASNPSDAETLFALQDALQKTNFYFGSATDYMAAGTKP